MQCSLYIRFFVPKFQMQGNNVRKCPMNLVSTLIYFFNQLLNNLADFSRTLFCVKFAFFAESCRAETHHPDSGGGVGGKGSGRYTFSVKSQHS